ncbi:U2 small nuclear ribonucleoprotein A [Seminavis robusta]|uniref:U2 small nuclear ribonucleoprotein A n=1 Tax=Seminavis robusta TaxID=568900 RepID=A0A9N8DII2_9STRA|nr:U2 small nuclear ribonucleoprotein A [Seminavis robusta]|eukprot:Sro102_g051900.1 U2 small nuclear ribonucleoprotein A (261) ;mRNA; f:9037-10118
MRLSSEILSQAEQRTNVLDERELVLRGLAIPAIEHLAVTRDAFDTIDFCDNRLLRLENFPRLSRLSSLICSGNLIESFDHKNIQTNTPNWTNLVLSENRISSLHEVAKLGEACPKLQFLSLVGNPVTKRQHYRLYIIHRIPSLKTLDYVKITTSERDRAKRLANSAAGAALESDVQKEALSTKTFVPGEGESAQETFVTNFTPEQKEQIRQLVANAKSPAEIDEIERSVQRGVFPQHLLDRKRAAEDDMQGNDNKRGRQE